MGGTTPIKRKRAKHTRSKLGCSVCRIRRVRCDQTRPACANCTSTGRKCEGFPELAPQRAFAFSRPIQPHAVTRIDPDETLSFAYFRINTSDQFAGPFANEFWTDLVLQLGTREECVRHAIVALGALHKSYADEHALVSRPDRTHGRQMTHTATSFYTRALAELNKLIHPSTYENLHVPLLCCILFVSFEWLRGSYPAATMHLQSGLSILRQWSSTAKTTSSPTAHLIRRHIAPVFVSLSLQVCTFSHDNVLMPWLSTGLFAPAEPHGTTEAEHRRAARTALDTLCSDVYLRPLERGWSYEFELTPEFSSHFTARLANWHAEYHMHLLALPDFSIYDASQYTSLLTEPLPTPRPGKENLILTLWSTTLTLLLRTSGLRNTDPLAYDPHTHLFAAMLWLCRLLLSPSPAPSSLSTPSPLSTSTSTSSSPTPATTPKLASATAKPPPPTPRFAIDLQSIPMLYLAATRCRHPVLRRAAISLLRSRSCGREGLWDAPAAARLAEEIVRVEEEGAGVDVDVDVDVGKSGGVCSLDTGDGQGEGGREKEDGNVEGWLESIGGDFGVGFGVGPDLLSISKTKTDNNKINNENKSNSGIDEEVSGLEYACAGVGIDAIANASNRNWIPAHARVVEVKDEVCLEERWIRVRFRTGAGWGARKVLRW